MDKEKHKEHLRDCAKTFGGVFVDLDILDPQNRAESQQKLMDLLTKKQPKSDNGQAK
jgi:hypothetical protein